MRAREATILFVLGSVGCHNCGTETPEASGTDTDPFAGDETCGFVCADDSTGGPPITTAPPDDDTGSATTTGTGTGDGAMPQDECLASTECDAGSFCVAPFDQTLGPNGKGAYACVAECVPLFDEDLWCADASACCDPEATCTDRGYCELPDAGTGSDSGGSGTDGSDSATDDSGTDTGELGTTGSSR